MAAVRGRKRDRCRAAGLWTGLALAAVVTMVLAGMLAHQRGSVAVHGLARSMARRAMEDVARSAAAEAMHRVSALANDPDAEEGACFEALRSLTGEWEATVAVSETRRLAAEVFDSLDLEVGPVGVRLGERASANTGLFCGTLHVVVPVACAAGRKEVRFQFQYYLDGCPADPASGERLTSNRARVGRAPRMTTTG